MEPVQQLFLSNIETQGETEAELEIHQEVRDATNSVSTACCIKRYHRRGKSKTGNTLQFAQSFYTEKEGRNQAESYLPHRQVTNSLMLRFNQLSVTFFYESTRVCHQTYRGIRTAAITQAEGRYRR